MSQANAYPDVNKSVALSLKKASVLLKAKAKQEAAKVSSLHHASARREDAFKDEREVLELEQRAQEAKEAKEAKEATEALERRAAEQKRKLDELLGRWASGAGASGSRGKRAKTKQDQKQDQKQVESGSSVWVMQE